MRALRVRRVIVVTQAGLVLGVVAMLVAPNWARADTGTGGALGGYEGTAQADGVHALYNPEGVLPVGAIVDLGAPDAYATIATGPATYSRASVAYPGDLLANPDALLAQGVAGYKSGTLPQYPYRAVASSGTVPHAESSPAPGLDARATAGDSGSSAVATMPQSGAPAIATFGSTFSSSTTQTDGSTVTVHAHSEISNLSVLGTVTIGSIVTDVTAKSDGKTTTLSGGTTVTDGAVLGTPVEIDAGGVRPAPGTTSTTSPMSKLLGSAVTPIAGNINDVLAHAGLHVTAAGPVKTGTNQAGMMAASGLRIDLELSKQTLPALTALLDLIPSVPNPVPGAPGIGDALVLAKARHLVTLEMGRGMVALTATRIDPVAQGANAPASGAGSSLSAPSTAGGNEAPVGVATGGRGPGVQGLREAPSLSTAAPAGTRGGSAPLGVGIGVLAVLALLVQPLFGDRLARVATGMLGPDNGPDCPWEGR